MSDAGAAPAPRPTVDRIPLLVALVAGGVAACLAGRGLLVPAGSDASAIRVGAAAAALVGAGALLRLDGPGHAARSLGLVAGVGVAVAVASLPFSVVDVGEAGVLDAVTDTDRGDAEDGGRTVVLDQVGPEAAPGGTLTLPPGAEVVLDGDDVLLRLPDGASRVLGRAGGTGAPPAPGATGAPPAGIVVIDGVPQRTDGGPLGADVPLGGLGLDGGVGGTRVVVGEGVLLDVPTPEPGVDPGPEGPLADGRDAMVALLLLALALVAFAPPLVRRTARVADAVVAPLPPPDPRPAPTRGAVEDGLAAVLRDMLADPDPRTAVIGAYARLLAALDEVGLGRRSEEAPHEHLWRSLGPLGVRRAQLHRLAELFVRARFTPHPVTEAHRQAAIGALADAVADLRLRAEDVDDVARRLAGVGPSAVPS